MNKNKFKVDTKGRYLKVGVIVWTVDPEGEIRFLLRHNKPFNGYKDEWTIAFGNVEAGEEEIDTARREAKEEFGIENFLDTLDLQYEVEFESKLGPTVIRFFALKVNDISTKVRLNEESIGYDWMTLDKVLQVMELDDEKKAFGILISKILSDHQIIALGNGCLPTRQAPPPPPRWDHKAKKEGTRQKKLRGSTTFQRAFPTIASPLRKTLF